VLWASADSDHLQRYLKDMYSSYNYVMRQTEQTDVLDYDKFGERVRALKTKTCGEILVSAGRPGLYTYREKMLRGYVRMQAEAHGIQLLGEEGQRPDKQFMHVPARTSTGYRHQSTVPRGVHFGRSRGPKQS
jgi:uncharacterized protein